MSVTSLINLRRRSGGNKGTEDEDEDEEERSEDDDDDDGIEWQEYLLSPLSVRFSQEVISGLGAPGFGLLRGV